jgi:hypothetical protein
MNIGFETKESAVLEKNRLIRDAKKYKKLYPNYDLNASLIFDTRIPTAMVGSNWRIKKVFYRKNTLKV